VLVELSQRGVKMYLTAVKYLAPVVLIGLLWWRYDYITTQNERLQSDLSKANEQLEQSQAIIAKERQHAAELALRAQKFSDQEAKDNDELQKLRTCYADKSCWPRVRIKTSCHSVSGSTPNAGTSEEITAELGEDAGRNILQLRAEIKETLRLVHGLQAELIARSSQNYCNLR
jgi:hypothetical protein